MHHLSLTFLSLKAMDVLQPPVHVRKAENLAKAGNLGALPSEVWPLGRVM